MCIWGKPIFGDMCTVTDCSNSFKSDFDIHIYSKQIDCIADRYQLPCYINQGETGIAADWSYGFSFAETQYVTIAHQDDVYEPIYTAEVLKKAQSAKHPVILYTDYFELRNGQRIEKTPLLRTKRLMNIPIRLFPGSQWVRRRVLSFGNPICCPAVHSVPLPVAIFSLTFGCISRAIGMRGNGCQRKRNISLYSKKIDWTSDTPRFRNDQANCRNWEGRGGVYDVPQILVGQDCKTAERILCESRRQ